MLGGFEPNVAFLNEQVPLWFALLMAFTSPYMWSKYVKKAVKKVGSKYLGVEGEE